MKRKNIGWAAIVAALVIILIFVGYQIDVFGFNGYHTVTIATLHIGTSPATVTRTVVEVPAKSLWDWMQLLFVPAILTLGAIWFTGRQSQDTEIAQNQHKHDEM